MNIRNIIAAIFIIIFAGMWLFVAFWTIAESADTAPEEAKAQDKERRRP